MFAIVFTIPFIEDLKIMEDENAIVDRSFGLAFGPNPTAKVFIPNWRSWLADVATLSADGPCVKTYIIIGLPGGALLKACN